MSKKKDILDILKWAGIFVLVGATVVNKAYMIMDIIRSYHTGKSQGLPLLANDIHLKKGDHNFVITDSFYSELTNSNFSEESKKMIIDGLKEAYTTLDYYNSQLNFKLATTVDEAAEKYSITKVNKVGKQDIALYMTDKVLKNNENIMANTESQHNPFNYEIENVNITFRTKYANAIWQAYDTIEETLAPKNTVIYTMAVHEGMHAMGFAHIDDHESIMNTYTKENTPRDLTEYDIEMMDKYNVQFYGAESTLKASENRLKITKYTKTEEDLEM